jgi:carboxyl-terminal processing protease
LKALNKSYYRPLVIAIAISAAVFLGSKLVPSNQALSFSSSKMSGIHKLNEVLNYIEESYVDTVKKGDLIEDGIQSLLRDLDPHSFYIPKEHFREMNESLEGNFEGIGIEFRIIMDTIMVITTIDGGPSKKVGLKAGDRIVSVNDSIIAGKNTLRNADVMKLLKGPRLSTVNVGIKRKHEQSLLPFEIKRDRIPITSVQCHYMIDNETGYIRVSRFSKTTYEEFKEASDELLEQGMKNYVVDMRGNPGGLLNESIEMANEFLKKDMVIVYTEGKARPKKVYYADSDGDLLNINLVVLLDESSASASEVFAGAIQDNDRGTIVGRRSFGKGLVQEQIDWPDGSALRLTVARYYTPAGRSIQKPYKDVDNYHMETYERIGSGELDNADSIHFADSLKFFTIGGRVVYGGGGIVPDEFVPIDTLNYNTFYNNLYKKLAIQNFSFNYVDERRKSLLNKYPNWKSFNKRFKLSDDEFEQFLQYATERKVERNPLQVALMKDKIINDLRAQFARHLYGNEGYYPMLNQSDLVIVTSLETFH